MGRLTRFEDRDDDSGGQVAEPQQPLVALGRAPELRRQLVEAELRLGEGE